MGVQGHPAPPPFDADAVRDVLESEYGRDVPDGEVEQLRSQLDVFANLLQNFEGAVAEAAVRLQDKGLIEVSPEGKVQRCKGADGSVKLGPRDHDAKWFKKRSVRVGKAIRSALPIKPKHHLPAGGTGEAFTTRNHSSNYALMDLADTYKIFTYGINSDSAAPGVGEIPKLFTLGFHAATIHGVKSAREAAMESAMLDVVTGFDTIREVLECLRRGELPPFAKLARWTVFWQAAFTWDRTACIAVKVLGEQQTGEETGGPFSSSLALKAARRSLAELRQTRVGWMRDCPGALASAAYGIAKCLSYVAHLDHANFLAVVGMILAPFDVAQGLLERVAAEMTRALAEHRMEVTQNALDQLPEDENTPHRRAILESLVAMFKGDVKTAGAEKKYAGVRAFVLGPTRAVAGLLAMLGTAMPFVAPVLYPSAVAIAGTGQVIFDIALCVRQYKRWAKAHDLKVSERDFRQYLAQHGGETLASQWDALKEALQSDFTVEREVGEFRNGQEGFGHAYDAAYAPGENGVMAADAMAWDIVFELLDQAEDPALGSAKPYFLQYLGELVFDGLSPLAFREGALELLYAGDARGAVDMVASCIRRQIEAPAPRASEVIAPSVFASDFECAQERVRKLLTSRDRDESIDPDPNILLEKEFFAEREGGRAFNPKDFDASMEALGKVWDEKYQHVEKAGVYAHMVAFHQWRKERSRPVSKLAVHLKRWEAWDIRGYGNGPNRDQLLEFLKTAADAPGATWQAQVTNAVIQSSKPPSEVCASLLKALAWIEGADAPPFVDRFRTELRQILEQVDEGAAKRLDLTTKAFDANGWLEVWQPMATAQPLNAQSPTLRGRRLLIRLLKKLKRGQGSLGERLPAALARMENESEGKEKGWMKPVMMDAVASMRQSPQGLSGFQREFLEMFEAELKAVK